MLETTGGSCRINRHSTNRIFLKVFVGKLLVLLTSLYAAAASVIMLHNPSVDGW